MPVTLTVHDSQYPAQITAQLHGGLRARQLPGKFLYDSPAQAQRWLAYHQAYSPSRTESTLLALYQEAFQAALRTATAPAVHYVSLGCGGGTKDVLFLQQALAQCAALCFTPMDVSAALVIETMLRLQNTLPAVASFPLVVDLEARPDLLPLFARHEPANAQRILACFGMLPNFAYQTFLPYLRHLMRPTDLLLLSANLSPLPYPQSLPLILPQYDNPFAHAWFGGLLESLGFAAADLLVTVQAQTLSADGQVWQIRANAQCQRQIHLTVYEEQFTFTPGEHLQVFFSNRFTPQIMPQLLAEAGLTVVETFLFASQEEGIYLCTAATGH
jgi:uncharacterized SAM-dependent methyltransferase